MEDDDGGWMVVDVREARLQNECCMDFRWMFPDLCMDVCMDFAWILA